MLQTLKPKEIIMTSLKIASASLVALVALSAGSAFALDRTAAQRQADGDAARASRYANEGGSTPNLGNNRAPDSHADSARRAGVIPKECRNDHTAGQCLDDGRGKA